MDKTANDILETIKRSATVLVCGHIRPDGDCVSSAVAIKLLCEKLGKKADAVCDADRPVSFTFLPGYDGFCTTRFEYYDLFIAVDCANDKRLGKYRQQLEDAAFSINIDHHPTNNLYGRINHIDHTASSTCAIIYELFRDSGYIDKNIATALYTGLSTDTGHFMHANTDARVFQTARELCGYGIDIGALNHAIYCNKTPQKIKLTARALDGMSFYGDGSVALINISLEDLKSCGCTSEDTEGLIDNASSVGGVQISIAMCEQPGGLYRVSFRSVEADVAAVAGLFGGGGHKLAAGCVIPGTRRDVSQKIISAALAALGKQA